MMAAYSLGGSATLGYLYNFQFFCSRSFIERPYTLSRNRRAGRRPFRLRPRSMSGRSFFFDLSQSVSSTRLLGRNDLPFLLMRARFVSRPLVTGPFKQFSLCHPPS